MREGITPPCTMETLVAEAPSAVCGPDALRLAEDVVPHDLEVLVEVVWVSLVEIEAIADRHAGPRPHPSSAQACDFTHQSEKKKSRNRK